VRVHHVEEASWEKRKYLPEERPVSRGGGLDGEERDLTVKRKHLLVKRGAPVGNANTLTNPLVWTKTILDSHE
jgi:hypothetical protein